MKEPLLSLGTGIGFRSFASFKTGLKTLGELGYKYLLFDWSGLINKKEKDIKKAAGLVKESGLEPFSMHAPPYSYPGKGETISTIISFHKPIMEMVSILGVKYITHHPGWPKDVKNTMNFEPYLKKIGYKRYMETNYKILSRLCEEARKLNLSITIENGPQGFLADLATWMSDILNIIKTVGMPNLGICLDIGHTHLSRVDMKKEIIVAGKYLWDTHFHDNFGLTQGRYSDPDDAHQPVGIGTINWIKVISGLKAIRFKGPVIFELIGKVGNYYQNLELNRQNWEFLINFYNKTIEKGKQK